jgi:hypothetical protein
MTAYEWSDRLETLEKSRQAVIFWLETDAMTRFEAEEKIAKIDEEITELLK